MTARQWTREGLDAAHPEVKAAGWSWALRSSGQPYAVQARSGSRHEVDVAADTLRSEALVPMAEPYHLDPPPSIALAVILASRGQDSLGAMADALDGFASHEGGDISTTPQDAASGAYRHAAMMLRRGTVAP